jgi:hypothetical protein
MAALKNYVLNGPSVIIYLDDRDPDVSWLHHIQRAGTGRGGVDLVAPVGTPVYAPTAGWVRRRPNNGTAGNSMIFEHRDNPGWGDVFSHLSSYTGADNQFFNQGQLIAYSGNTGGVAQHLHRHLEYKGIRYNPWNYFSLTSSTAGSGSTPININTNRMDDDMKLAWDTGGTGWLVTEDGWGGLPSMQFYDLFKRLIVSNQTSSRPETFNRAEVDMMNGQIRLLALANNTQAPVTLDPVKLASAVADALNTKGIKVSVADLQDLVIDPEVLAEAFAQAAPRVASVIIREQTATLKALADAQAVVASEAAAKAASAAK